MLDALNNQRATFGLEPVATMLEVTARTGPRVAATSPTFDPPGSSVSIVQVGPIRPRLSAPGSETPSAPVDRPLAVVGLSAGWMHQVELLQRILDALAPLDVWTWMTLGPSVASSELSAPPNAQLFAALPHDAVLPGAALLITHAGHGTVMAGLRHGVPMVCVPLGRDQPVNAARAVALGVAITVDAAAAVDTIRDAATTVLGDPAMRARCRELAPVIAGETRVGVALDVLEQLAERAR